MKYFKSVFLSTPFASILFSCSKEDTVEAIVEEEEEVVLIDDTDFVASDQTTESHSKDTEPSFAEVFEDNSVKRLDLVITEVR